MRINWKAVADLINSIPLSKEGSECRCRGDCPCHIFAQMCGVPCPPECRNHGAMFDGCHRCDCPTPGARVTANASTRA